MLNFGAIISATFCRNRGNTPKGSTPPYASRSRSRLRRTQVQKAKELKQFETILFPQDMIQDIDIYI